MQNNDTLPAIPRDSETTAYESYSGAAGVGAVWLIFYLLACGVAMIARGTDEAVQASIAVLH
jgi:hypothetical protein